MEVRTALQEAALALFDEQGFDSTTAAAIAARAGVTERTFFRYFPDKREVLFAGQEQLRAALLASVESAPAMAPLATLLHALHAVVPMIEGNRAFGARRQRLIARTPALHERELAKLNSLAQSLAATLVFRGRSPLEAMLAAQLSMVAFAQAFDLWINDPAADLSTCLDRALDALPLR